MADSSKNNAFLLEQAPHTIPARILLTLAVLAWMLLIFLFSAQGGEESMETSGKLAVPIANTIAQVKGIPRSGHSYRQLLDTVQMVVRKSAHFSEYAILGILCVLMLMSYQVRRYGLLSAVISGMYAASDEVHQFFQGARTGMWQDVVLDTLGAVCGILLWGSIWRRICEKRIRKQADALSLYEPYDKV